MKLDFHCHTHYSADSIIKPKELAEKAKRLDIVPAITEHNTIGSHTELRNYKMEFLPGEEIRTIEGDLIALYLNELIPKKTPFLEALDKIKEQGAISYLPHMYDTTRHGIAVEELAQQVDIIEVFNARCPVQSFNDRAGEFAKTNKKLTGAGSDSHFLFEFGRTYFEIDVDYETIRDNPKALLRALKTKQITIHGKKAPLFVRGTTRLVKLAKKLFGR